MEGKEAIWRNKMWMGEEENGRGTDLAGGGAEGRCRCRCTRHAVAVPAPLLRGHLHSKGGGGR